MKIVCDSCSTKYSISDDKVRGKVFKIRCKKCSHIIVVRGTGDGAPTAAEAPTDAVWHLVVDGDQVGPLGEAEVRARLSRGEISAENYVWKEGFSDWLRLVDVPEFADLGQAAPVGELFSDSGPVAVRSKSGHHPIVSEQEAAFAAAPAAHEARAATKVASGRVRAPAEAVAIAAPVAEPEQDAFSVPAVAARGSETGDLFGIAAPQAARADSGRVKARSANGAGGGSGRHDGGRVENLTAQRSENSVLFSLSNLQSLAAPAAAPKPGASQTTEGSGLIDIRAMAASTMRAPSASAGPMLFGAEASKAAADELPTFGAFSSAAPVLFPIPSSSGPPKWLYALIALAGILVVAVGFAAFSILMRKPVVEQAPAPAVAVAPAPAPVAPAARTLADNELPPRERDKDEASAGDKTDKGSGEKAASKDGHHGKAAKKGSGGRSTAGGDTKSNGESASQGSAKPEAPSETDKPKAVKGSLDDLLEGALSQKARGRKVDDDSGGSRKGGGDSGGGAGGGALAKSAVVAGMNGIKGKVAGCYSQYKVPGMAMVNVVIGKSGKVTSASVTGKFASTPTGTCVENAVKSASFPPSDGLTTPYPFNLR